MKAMANGKKCLKSRLREKCDPSTINRKYMNVIGPINMTKGAKFVKKTIWRKGFNSRKTGTKVNPLIAIIKYIKDKYTLPLEFLPEEIYKRMELINVKQYTESILLIYDTKVYLK